MAMNVHTIHVPTAQYNIDGKPAINVVAIAINALLYIILRKPFERYNAIPSTTMEIPKVTIKDGTLNFANKSPLIKPNPTHTSNATGITIKPILSIYKTHIMADSFSRLITEKSKEPIIITNVKPHAATKK